MLLDLTIHKQARMYMRPCGHSLSHIRLIFYASLAFFFSFSFLSLALKFHLFSFMYLKEMVSKQNTERNILKCPQQLQWGPAESRSLEFILSLPWGHKDPSPRGITHVAKTRGKIKNAVRAGTHALQCWRQSSKPLGQCLPFFESCYVITPNQPVDKLKSQESNYN